MKGLFDYEGPVMEALNTIGDCICLSAMWCCSSCWPGWFWRC